MPIFTPKFVTVIFLTQSYNKENVRTPMLKESHIAEME